MSERHPVESNALVGHTGFVGGTLRRAGAFATLVNSSNVDMLRGRQFDLLVCAGVSAVKWLANKDPEADRAGIRRLTDALAEARVREFVLISTVDVYPHPGDGADEDAEIMPAENHAYGRHRLELEAWVLGRFGNVRIIRLPALFGAGLRKNALYDLLHDNQVGNINPAGVFQWYPTARLWDDLQLVRHHDLRLVNLVPEPLPMSAIIDTFFPGAPVGAAVQPAPRYDLRSRHAKLFDTMSATAGYMMPTAAVLDAMAQFVNDGRELGSTRQ